MYDKYPMQYYTVVISSDVCYRHECNHDVEHKQPETERSYSHEAWGQLNLISYASSVMTRGEGVNDWSIHKGLLGLRHVFFLYPCDEHTGVFQWASPHFIAGRCTDVCYNSPKSSTNISISQKGPSSWLFLESLTVSMLKESPWHWFPLVWRAHTCTCVILLGWIVTFHEQVTSHPHGCPIESSPSPWLGKMRLLFSTEPESWENRQKEELFFPSVFCILRCSGN